MQGDSILGSQLQSSPNNELTKESYKDFVKSVPEPVVVRFIHSNNEGKSRKSFHEGYFQRVMALSRFDSSRNCFLLEIYWDQVLEYCSRDFDDVNVDCFRFAFLGTLIYALCHELYHLLGYRVPLDVRFEGGVLV